MLERFKRTICRPFSIDPLRIPNRSNFAWKMSEKPVAVVETHRNTAPARTALKSPYPVSEALLNEKVREEQFEIV